MNSLIYFVEGLGLLFAVNAFNYYSLDPVSQPNNLNQPYQNYNPYSLYQDIPTPLSPRFFLFSGTKSSFLTFPRVQSCMSIFLADVHGSCLNFATCILKGGKPVGKCNLGLKTCCIPFLGSSALPVSTFTRNSFTQNPAKFSIRRASPHFCQVRLDFKNFDVGNTNQDGICVNGNGLMITGNLNTNGVPGVICGLNTGQHVYLNFNGNAPINLMINFDETLFNTTNQWSIKVTQIPCSDSENLAPQGCLQYYREPVGNVRSFNFRQRVSSDDFPNDGTTPPLTYQLSNTDYNVCIGSPTNSFSQITWTKGVGTTNFYFVVSSIPRISLVNAGTFDAAAFGSDCFGTNPSFPGLTNDYVEIPGGQYTDPSTNVITPENTYCGFGFPSSVTSKTKQFKLHVFTNGVEFQAGAASEGSVGFSLSYILS